MKKMLLFIIVVTFSYSSYGQEFKALDKSPLDMIEYPAQRGKDKVMRVIYSRPQLRGRELIRQSQMENYGEQELMNQQRLLFISL